MNLTQRMTFLVLLFLFEIDIYIYIYIFNKFFTLNTVSTDQEGNPFET